MQGASSHVRLFAALSAALLVFSLGGCTGSPEPPGQPSPATPPSTSQPPVEPAFVPVLEKYRDGVLADGGSSVVIQIKSRIGDWSDASGIRSLENQEPAQLTDQVHVGDLTMAMVAVSVMKLAEEGKLQLDDPITKYLPDFETMIRPPAPVSVRSFLNHQSGMPDYWETLVESAPLDQVLARSLSHEERLRIAASRPWDRQGFFRYSGSNYAALALLVERLRGQKLENVLHADIIQPLGLQNTLMAGPEPGPQDLLHGYVLMDGQRVDTALSPVILRSGDQGMISTVPDLNTLFGAMAQGKLLNTRTVVDMYTLNQVNKEEQYGLGLQQRYDACSNNYYFGHGGDVPGYASVALTSTDGSRQVAIAVAFAPTSPPGRFDEPVIDLLTVALESLNLAC